MNSLLLLKLVQLAEMWAVQVLDSELENKRAILQVLGGRECERIQMEISRQGLHQGRKRGSSDSPEQSTEG
jgi:hypothetical protein